MVATPEVGSAAKGSIVLAVLAVTLAAFMAVLDASIVNIAIPKMMAVFASSAGEIQWVLTAYMLTMGVITPVTGYLSERFGSKSVLLLSLLIFIVGSALCGAAWSTWSMVFFRIIQAIGGGMMMPVAMTIMLGLFPPQKRGLAMGITGIAIMFAPAVGPTLSGYITEYLNWRLIFYINVPVGIVDLILLTVLLQNQVLHKRKSFDFAGFVLSSAGFGALLYALSEGPSKGWASPEILFWLIIAVVALAFFIWVELSRKTEAMLDIRIFADTTFTLSSIIMSVATIALFGVIFFIPLFLQNLQGLSAMQTGLLMLPSALASGVMMPVSGMLYDKIGAKINVIVGLVIISITTYLLAQIDTQTSYQNLLWLMTIRGFGLGMTMMPITTAAIAHVTPDKMPQANALINTIRNVAGSIGIAILTSVLQLRQAFHAGVLTASASTYNVSTVETFHNLTGLFMQRGLSQLQAQAAALGQIMAQVQIAAFVQSTDDVLLVTTGITLFGLLLSLFIRNVKKTRASNSDSVQLFD
ncbi:MAG: drug resistance transporter, EmrB/QacA subfamily [Bacilli bacterium]|nr:drug resistance transporter, EmrB/QacA subfamily [Bacilli bacterium]